MNRLNRLMRMMRSGKNGRPYWEIAVAVRCPHNSYYWRESEHLGCNTDLVEPKEWWNGYKGDKK